MRERTTVKTMLPETSRRYLRTSHVLPCFLPRAATVLLPVIQRNRRRQRARPAWTGVFEQKSRLMTSEECLDVARRCRDAGARHQALFWMEMSRGVREGLVTQPSMSYVWKTSLLAGKRRPMPERS